MCDFEFLDYILFVGGVSNTVRVDDEINLYGIENVKTDALQKMVEGLKEEAKDKEYIDNKDITDTNISDFLKKVRFVVDDRKPSEYVRAIIKDHPGLVPEEKVLDAIFNEIRDKQAGKKNVQIV
jgi:Tfp pilus assembly pilus retraction ATPase PilT